MSPPCVFYSSSGYEWLVVVELQKYLRGIWHHWIGQKKMSRQQSKYGALNSPIETHAAVFFFSLNVLKCYHFVSLPFCSSCLDMLSFLESKLRVVSDYIWNFEFFVVYTFVLSLFTKEYYYRFCASQTSLRLIKFLMNHTNVRVSCTVYYENIFYN